MGAVAEPAITQNDLENELSEILSCMQVLYPKFTGSITLHYSQGGLGDIDRYEKNLKRFDTSAKRLSKLSK